MCLYVYVYVGMCILFFSGTHTLFMQCTLLCDQSVTQSHLQFWAVPMETTGCLYKAWILRIRKKDGQSMF